MAPLRTYLLSTMAAVAAVRAADFGNYVPKCAQECFNQAADDHSSNCDDRNDTECMCSDSYTMKLHADSCMKEHCSDKEYGEAELGFDNWCKSLGGGGDGSPTTTGGGDDTPTTSQSPTSNSVPQIPPPVVSTTTGAESSTTAVETSATQDSSSSYPVFTSLPGTAQPTTPTSGVVPPPTTVPTNSGNGTVPTPTGGQGGGDGGNGGGDGGDGGANPTASPPPDAAGAHLTSSFGVLAGGVLLAAYLGM